MKSCSLKETLAKNSIKQLKQLSKAVKSIDDPKRKATWERLIRKEIARKKAIKAKRNLKKGIMLIKKARVM